MRVVLLLVAVVVVIINDDYDDEDGEDEDCRIMRIRMKMRMWMKVCPRPTRRRQVPSLVQERLQCYGSRHRSLACYADYQYKLCRHRRTTHDSACHPRPQALDQSSAAARNARGPGSATDVVEHCQTFNPIAAAMLQTEHGGRLT